ncbi:MAG: HD domain-containing protein [Planctomycetota bacterium]|nr:HD domain-containing protein [Planctomycetota bacterium]
MNQIHQIPEMQSLNGLQDVIRIPCEIDVPMTRRVRKLIDTPEFRRLARISQLGLVSLVYPAANHTRFEHSLGVYRMALLYLQRLSQFDRFHKMVTQEDAELFIVAALLHDLGHWPFCHPIEDLELPGVPEHELFANSFLLEGEVANTLRDDWGINPRDVVTLLSGNPQTSSGELLQSMLSGPIDIDKMDYLQRDSLHAGVPYGRNFDQQRLIGSLCLNPNGNRIAISEKGKTAAEMMVFARYVMFSEVYWHHTVRSATAMLQRVFFLIYKDLDLDGLFRLDQEQFIQFFRKKAKDESVDELAAGLFGKTRRLYKRLMEINYQEDAELYSLLAHQDYSFLCRCAELMASDLSRKLGVPVTPSQILIDAPPKGHETEFLVDIISAPANQSVELKTVSPVVNALAGPLFERQVKRVRVFVAPKIKPKITANIDLKSMLAIATELA